MVPKPGDDHRQDGPHELADGPDAAQPYQRRLSVVERILRLLVAPQDAMQDISLSPDYGGVVLILAAIAIVSAATTLTSYGKIQFVGTNAADYTSSLGSTVAVSVALVPVFLVIRWLAKSLLVRYSCNNGSNWKFAAAASVTGYAYLVGVVVGLIGLLVVSYFVPSVVIDTTDLDAAVAQAESYSAQVAAIQLLYMLPLSLIELIWKSYLGGLGAHIGTKKMCSFGQGIAVFLVLGAIGLALTFFG